MSVNYITIVIIKVLWVSCIQVFCWSVLFYCNIFSFKYCPFINTYSIASLYCLVFCSMLDSPVIVLNNMLCICSYVSFYSIVVCDNWKQLIYLTSHLLTNNGYDNQWILLALTTSATMKNMTNYGGSMAWSFSLACFFAYKVIFLVFYSLPLSIFWSLVNDSLWGQYLPKLL